MTRLRTVLATSLIASGIACNAATESLSIPEVENYDARSVAALYDHLADSVTTHGGDPTLSTVYSSVATAVRQNGRISRIVISVDGVPTSFYATARQTEIANSPCGATPVCLALAAVTIQRSLIAWQSDNPKRIIQLTSASDKDSVYAQIYPSFAAPNFPTALLVFMDGNGGTFFGTGGTQSVAMTPSSTECLAYRSSITEGVAESTTCTLATFAMQFASKVEPSSFLTGRNAATGSHAIVMSSQSLLGARMQLAPGLPPVPPILVTPAIALPASVAATVDGDVSFALTVTNDATTPATITFTSGQHYDFKVIEARTGATVWTWSADRTFLQALNTETIAARTSVIYTARWQPTQKGLFYIVGSLVSQSHHADAFTLFTVK